MFFSFAAKSLICCGFHHVWRQITYTPSGKLCCQGEDRYNPWKLNVYRAATDNNVAELNLVAEFAPKRLLEATDKGDTPLHCAAENCDGNSGVITDDAVSLLLSCKADVNAANIYGRTPLAVARDEDSRVKWLLTDAGGHE